jgi:transcriptional regulator with XRE-family HTH domain
VVTLEPIPLGSIMPAKSSDDPKTEFGIWLTRAMEMRGLNQTDLADKSGLTQVYISGLCRGIRNPSKQAAISIAESTVPDEADTEFLHAHVDDALDAAGFARMYGTSPKIDLKQAILDAPDEEVQDIVSAALERVAAMNNRAQATSIGFQSKQDAAVRANLGRTVEDQEKADAEALRRGREGRSRSVKG